MLTFISPAKNLKDAPEMLPKSTLPRRLEMTAKIIAKLKRQSNKSIKSLMKLSDALVALNVQRYQNFDLNHNESNSWPAITMFNGDVYQGLDTSSLGVSQFNFIAKNVRILSGLYGLLRPKDLIQPYRLEMGTKISIGRKANLYQFWQEEVTKLVKQDLEAGKHKLILNLASDEYWKCVNIKSIDVPIIKANFKEFRNGQYKFLSYDAKRARGMMLRYIIDHKIDDAHDLLGFDTAGYAFNPELSSENSLIFTR